MQKRRSDPLRSTGRGVAGQVGAHSARMRHTLVLSFTVFQVPSRKTAMRFFVDGVLARDRFLAAIVGLPVFPALPGRSFVIFVVLFGVAVPHFVCTTGSSACGH